MKELVPHAAVEMLRSAIERKADILRQRADLTKQAAATLTALKAATISRDELLAEKARLDEELKDATAMEQAAQRICDDETRKEGRNGTDGI